MKNKKYLVIAVAAVFVVSSVAYAQSVSTSTKMNSRDKIKAPVSSSTVSTAARDIRGWDEGEKAVFLGTVKAHAELRSGQDLENFAKGVLINDENVRDVTTASSSIEVSYKIPAKFLGVFGAGLEAMTDVSFDPKSKNPKEVTVKFPWYRIFYSLDADAREDVLKSAIEASIGEDPGTNSGGEYSKKGRTIQLISNILKALRAEVE
jgi:hypothetical protein